MDLKTYGKTLKRTTLAEVPVSSLADILDLVRTAQVCRRSRIPRDSAISTFNSMALNQAKNAIRISKEIAIFDFPSFS